MAGLGNVTDTRPRAAGSTLSLAERSAVKASGSNTCEAVRANFDANVHQHWLAPEEALPFVAIASYRAPFL